MPTEVEFPGDCELHSLTPVRRRPSSLAKGYLRGDPEKEWTTNRCHRLLRPLTSRITILEKDRTRCLSTSSGLRYQSSQAVSVPRCETENEELEQGDSQASDAEWTQHPARKRVKRTYSSKGVNRQQESTGYTRGRKISHISARKSLAPGEVTVPTPMLKRTSRASMLDETDMSFDHSTFVSAKQHRSRRRNAPDCESYLELLELRKTMSNTRYSTYEGIYNGLEALLKATNPDPQQDKAKGANSLLLTCLRAVPQYISDEQKILYTEAEENGGIAAFEKPDIATEVYDDLETLGSSQRGWKQLRLVVRSHGVHLMNDAIRKSLLDGPFCAVLVRLALEMGCADGADAILSAALAQHEIRPPHTAYSHLHDISTNGNMAKLWTLVYHEKLPSYQYRQVIRMLTGNVLPVEWLATKDIGRIWTSAIQTLASSNGYVLDATEFLREALTILGRSGAISSGTADFTGSRAHLAMTLLQTYSSVLTTLSTIAMLSKHTEDRLDLNVNNGSITEYYNIIEIFQSCLAEPSLALLSTQRALLLLASLVSQYSKDVTDEAVVYIDNLVGILLQERKQPGESSIYQAVVRFICSIAYCGARGTSTSALSHIRWVHDILDHLARLSTIPRAAILFEVIVDSATTFSEEEPASKNLDYAATVELRYEAEAIEPRHISRSDLGQTTGEGFRWEEGISEWVTATPAVHTAKTLQIASYDGTEEPVYDSPMRPYQLRKRVASFSELSDEGSPVTGSQSEQEKSDKEQSSGTESLIDESHLLHTSTVAVVINVTSQVLVTESRGRKRTRHTSTPRVQVWQDESDDELSFLSCTSSDDKPLQPVVVNTTHVGRQTRHQTAAKKIKQRSATKSTTVLYDDSEDELCI
ncbi:hypothetical protein PVAG01_01852 [Phlyctema vagabunda]|uniref:Wings apart-like protein C-terminal domain-containing protein n=1 Tax=Phlyctema vagabunda TaxID=108571 RepID=A0ABR4PYD3_9HELO